MTLLISPLTVATSISNLSIAGVTIKDVDEIPDTVTLLGPVIFPQPSGFIVDSKMERMTMGTMGSQKEDFTYTLNYVFLFAEVGSGLGAFAPYKPAYTLLVTVLNTIINNDVVSGLVDMRLNSIGNGIAAIQDPSGKRFWGAIFSLKCLEYA